MEFGQKKIFFREIDLFDFHKFFWPGIFNIFWPTVGAMQKCYSILAKWLAYRRLPVNSYYNLGAFLQLFPPKSWSNSSARVCHKMDSIKI